jgi:rubrerythrin
MDNELRMEIQVVAEFVEDEGLFRVRDLIRKLQERVDQLEQGASGPVQLSACPECKHWSLAGFKHCPLCGANKKEEGEP